jgi:hypothetical protein
MRAIVLEKFGRGQDGRGARMSGYRGMPLVFGGAA